MKSYNLNYITMKAYLEQTESGNPLKATPSLLLHRHRVHRLHHGGVGEVEHRLYTHVDVVFLPFCVFCFNTLIYKEGLQSELHNLESAFRTDREWDGT
jgi:hypothetical protein